MIIRGHGILWDPERHRPAARFVNGELSTEDERVIELARVAGLLPAEVTQEPAETESDRVESANVVVRRLNRMTKAQLANLVREYGVSVSAGAKAADIRAALLPALLGEQHDGIPE